MAAEDGEDETSVGAENRLSLSDGGGKSGVRASELVLVALVRVVGSEGDALPLFQSDLLRSIAEESGSDLGSLGTYLNRSKQALRPS